jgi:hypothetical protein
MPDFRLTLMADYLPTIHCIWLAKQHNRSGETKEVRKQLVLKITKQDEQWLRAERELLGE